ncbi:hypothetical protein ACOJD9_002819 [Cronobacter dublinensis]
MVFNSEGFAEQDLIQKVYLSDDAGEYIGSTDVLIRRAPDYQQVLISICPRLHKKGRLSLDQKMAANGKYFRIIEAELFTPKIGASAGWLQHRVIFQHALHFQGHRQLGKSGTEKPGRPMRRHLKLFSRQRLLKKRRTDE